MQISLLEKANLAPAEIEYVAFTFTVTGMIVYLLLVLLRLTALVGIWLLFIMTIIDTPIKVPPLAISLRLKGSTKFSSSLMDLRILSSLVLLSLALVTPKLCQAWLVLSRPLALSLLEPFRALFNLQRTIWTLPSTAASFRYTFPSKLRSWRNQKMGLCVLWFCKW